MLARVFATATCLSVRPDVRLSHADIVPSRVKAGSIVKCTPSDSAMILVSGKVWVVEKFARGHPKGTCQMRVGWVFSTIFDQYVVISRKRCILDTKLLWGGNRKPYAGYRMVSVSMTLSDPSPGFQGHGSFKMRVSPKRHILQTVSQKNDTDVTHYRFNPHQPISVIFGRDVAERVCYWMVIYYPTSPN